MLVRMQSTCAAYYRGGTSRAIMFRHDDLPADKSRWPHIFRATIGSPDPNGRQLDGMGGGLSSLSKVCVVGPSERDDADVDYTFAAIGVKDSDVDFSSNCGNMTSAVGPFAVDAGIIDRPQDGDCSVTICNTNSNKLIRAIFPVRNSEAVAEGDFSIDGVAGTAAKVALKFLEPAGSKTGKLLPTGNPTDPFDGIKVTCIDVGNPCVFVHASDLNVPGSIAADDIEAHPSLLGQLDTIRRKAAVAMGVARTEAEVPGSIPKIGMVSKPHDHRLLSGERVSQGWCDVIVRALSVGQPHRAVPITVALALAVASRLEGTTVNEATHTQKVEADGITIGHASGRLLVEADFGSDGTVKSATVYRTARRLMEGKIFWKA